MKSKVMIIVAILAMALIAAPASAITIYFTGTSSVSGSPLSAAATINTGFNSVSVDLWNLQTPMLNVSQLFSRFSFVLSDTPTGAATLSASNGTERAVTFPGTFVDTSPVAPGWGLSTTVATIMLDDLVGGSSPDHTIIGPPNVATGQYSSGNTSIRGNAQNPVPTHSPYMYGTAAAPVHWDLTVPGVTASTSVQSVTFSFNTAAGDDHTIVPIPGSVLLLGSGILGLVGLGWRSRKSS